MALRNDSSDRTLGNFVPDNPRELGAEVWMDVPLLMTLRATEAGRPEKSGFHTAIGTAHPVDGHRSQLISTGPALQYLAQDWRHLRTNGSARVRYFPRSGYDAKVTVPSPILHSLWVDQGAARSSCRLPYRRRESDQIKSWSLACSCFQRTPCRSRTVRLRESERTALEKWDSNPCFASIRSMSRTSNSQYFNSEAMS